MPAPPVLTSRLLDLPGVRHGFFTRQGGVSGGIYESLNVGLGSRDDPEAVAENRRRVARAAAHGQIVVAARQLDGHAHAAAHVLAIPDLGGGQVGEVLRPG